MKLLYRYGLGGLVAVLLALAFTGAAQADSIFVSTTNGNTIGECTTSGTLVNASLISGLNGPAGLSVSGSDLFVVNFGNGTIGEYTTSGTTVNASLISGLNGPTFMAIVPSAPAATPEPSTQHPGASRNRSCRIGIHRYRRKTPCRESHPSTRRRA